MHLVVNVKLAVLLVLCCLPTLPAVPVIRRRKATDIARAQSVQVSKIRRGQQHVHVVCVAWQGMARQGKATATQRNATSRMAWHGMGSYGGNDNMESHQPKPLDGHSAAVSPVSPSHQSSHPTCIKEMEVRSATGTRRYVQQQVPTTVPRTTVERPRRYTVLHRCDAYSAGTGKVPSPAVWVPACCLGEAAFVPASQGWICCPPVPPSCRCPALTVSSS